MSVMTTDSEICERCATRDTFEAMLSEIRGIRHPTAEVVMSLASDFWERRPSDANGWEVEFIKFARACWRLSTCRDSDRMADFEQREDNGHPLFADAENVAEFDPRLPDNFSICPWTELEGE